MLDYLADWYRLVSITPDSEMLGKRKQGIEKYVVGMNMQSAFEVVRLFLGYEPKNNKFIDELRAAFRDVDELFQLRDNDLEMRVLAAASIEYCTSSNHKHSTNIALATICASFQKTDTLSIVDETINLSHKFLNMKSVNLRSREALPSIKLDIKLDELKKSLQTSVTYDTLAPAIDYLKHFSSVKKALNILEKSLRAQEEETDILWWLLGEYSNDLKCNVASLEQSAATIISAKELADKTRIIPGPISIEAFLSKAIQKSKQNNKDTITLKEAINSTPLDWRDKTIGQKLFDDVIDLCPVHCAIRKSVESGDDDSWIAGFEKQIEIKADKQLSPLLLSLQTYKECLLVENIQKR